MAMQLLIAFIAVLLAMLFGLLAALANPMLVGLGLGMVGGALLLVAPAVSIYLLLGVGLTMGALISFAGAAFGKLPWAMSFLGFFLLLPVFQTVIHPVRKPVPGFIWLAITFMFYALFTTVAHWSGLVESLAGFKRYFQTYGLLLALALLPIAEVHFHRWRRMLVGVALLQLPFALYELLVLVPKRGGLQMASFTTDVVAGTFGANLEGGSPGGVMVVFLLICFCFLFSRWRNRLIDGRVALLGSLFFLLPIGMGENKVVMIMMPLIWLVMVRHDLMRSPAKYFPVLLGGGLVTAVLGYVYIGLIMHSNLVDVVTSTVQYNFGSGQYGSHYLNRSTVLSFWWDQQGFHDPVGFFFGHGLGSAFVGQISGHVGLHYLRYGIDLTAASALLWDLGIVGVALFIAILIGAWRAAVKINHIAVDARVKADVIAIQAAIALFLLMTFYSQDIVNLISMEIVYSVVLGYLAHLYSNYVPKQVRI